MKQILIFVLAAFVCQASKAQASPCSADPVYRQFDFWIGNWEAFGPAGKKAGDSKISLILDSCIILEEWTSTALVKNLRYQGKSFNTYNAQTKQWQQTWVDNTGITTHYLLGKAAPGRITFQTMPPTDSNDTSGINRLTFFKLDENKVRQLGELSKDNGKTWVTQYDLEYRRKTSADN